MELHTLRAFVKEAAAIQKEAVSQAWIGKNVASWAARANPANPETMKRLARVKGKMTRMGTAASDAAKTAPSGRDAVRLSERATTLRGAAGDVPAIAKEFAGGKSYKALAANPRQGMDMRINRAHSMHPGPQMERYGKLREGKVHPLAGKVIPKSRVLQGQNNAAIMAAA